MVVSAVINDLDEGRLQLTHRGVLSLDYLSQLAVVSMMRLFYDLDLAWTQSVYHFIAIVKINFRNGEQTR